jgi:hypothetical protein
VALLFLPAICAVVVYFRGSPVTAVAINGAVPLLVFGGAGVAMLADPPSRITPGGLLMFAVPAADLCACAAVLWSRHANAAVFWLTWLVNAATVGFLFYLAFLFRIF